MQVTQAKARAMACVVTAAAVSGTARADERGPHLVRADLGAAYSLRAGDQRDSFGFGGALGYEYRLLRAFGVGGRLSGLLFPYDESVYDGGGLATYAALGPVARAHLTPGSARLDLAVEVGVEGVVTGPFVRFGGHAGIAADILVSRGIAVGPFVHYLHVLQPNDAARGGADGRLLLFGVGVSYGALDGLAEDETPDATDEPVEPAEPAEPVPDGEPADAPEPAPAIDSDADTVADSVDSCPTQPGVPPSGCPSPTEAVEAPAQEPPQTDGPLPSTSNPTTTRPATTTTGRPPAQDDVDGGTSEGEPAAPIAVRIQFASASATIDGEAAELLRGVKAQLERSPATQRVVVAGYADELGDPGYNRELSQRRAQAVVDWLVARGIARRRLTARGYGSDRPVVSGTDPAALAPNRRVEFYVVDPPVDTAP